MEESEDKYSDEFDSYSKSQSAMQLPSMDKIMVPSSVKQNAPSLYKAPLTKKDGKVTQTDEGKYSYMPATQGGYTSSGKEKALQRHLDDAE